MGRTERGLEVRREWNKAYYQNVVRKDPKRLKLRNLASKLRWRKQSLQFHLDEVERYRQEIKILEEMREKTKRCLFLV